MGRGLMAIVWPISYVDVPYSAHEALMTADTDLPTNPGPGVPDGFRRALQAAEVGLWCWDLRSGSIELSPTATAVLGCSSRPATSYAGFIAAFHPDDRAAAEQALHNSVASAGPFDFDVRAASTGRWLRIRGQATDGHAPEVAGILIYKGQRTAVEMMKGRLAAIVASPGDAIIGKTLDGIVTDWNAGAEAIFGYTAAEAIGNPLTMLLPPGQDDEMTRILARIGAGERVEHYETKRLRKDGRVIDVSMAVSPVWDDAGRLVGASKVARDITAARMV
jgi:two-component system sensor kinase FixL